MGHLGYVEMDTAAFERAQDIEAARDECLEHNRNRAHATLASEIEGVLKAGDLVSGRVICAEQRGVNHVALEQDALDAFLDSVMNNDENVKLLAKLMATDAAAELRAAMAKAHADAYAESLAQAWMPKC